MSMQRLASFGLVIPLLLVAIQPLWAGEYSRLEKELEQAYKDKVLTVRGLYQGDRLEYDAKGNVLGGATSGAWTLYGRIEVKDVRLKKNTLEIEGNRLFLRYDQQQGDFSHVRNGKVRIRIRLEPARVGVQELNLILERVFLTDKDSLVDQVPAYWRAFIRDWLTRRDEATGADSLDSTTGKDLEAPSGVVRVTPNFSPPSCLSCPEPVYPEPARNAGVEGTAYLWAVVDAEGRVEELHVKTPIGMGLDDAAAETVRYWRFEPAKRDGKPVAFQFSLEIVFRLKR